MGLLGSRLGVDWLGSGFGLRKLARMRSFSVLRSCLALLRVGLCEEEEEE